jgi:membrane protease YdiL (CAAX protease family)
LALPVLDGVRYLAAVAISALVLSLLTGRRERGLRPVDRRSLLTIAGMYVGVLALMRLAFVGFTTEHVAGLFLSFAAALLLGVAGPVVVTAWVERRPLADLGLGLQNWRPTVVLAVLFGGVQFSLTLWGYDLPAPVDWVPLLMMALTVGVFESVFFRGYVQNRLGEQFGQRVGVAGAAVLYGLYHVGYGMGSEEIAFLTGLGVVYAVAFALTRNLLVLWPLLTPLGSFYASLEAGDIQLPWASIAGFADVLGVMLVVLWLAHRHLRRQAEPEPAGIHAADRSAEADRKR